jgi:hypothetical protein
MISDNDSTTVVVDRLLGICGRQKCKSDNIDYAWWINASEELWFGVPWIPAGDMVAR